MSISIAAVTVSSGSLKGRRPHVEGRPGSQLSTIRRAEGSPYSWKIIQTSAVIVFLFEGNIHSYRQIFMDRSEHNKDANPTWYGDSIGRWDGETLSG
jgi:hypothetical protein